jgi:microsomal dipeptidase-like Zn-dependent dipeptidase
MSNFNFFAVGHTNAQAEWVNTKGMSNEGKKLLTRALERGIIPDLAHASDATVHDALPLIRSFKMPWIVSHTGSRHLHNVERNISAEILGELAKDGGMVGVTFWGELLRLNGFKTEASGTPGFIQHFRDISTTLTQFVSTNSVRPASSVSTPAASVAFGSDFNGFITREPGVITAAQYETVLQNLAASNTDTTQLKRSALSLAHLLQRADAIQPRP